MYISIFKRQAGVGWGNEMKLQQTGHSQILKLGFGIFLVDLKFKKCETQSRAKKRSKIGLDQGTNFFSLVLMAY